MNGYCLNKDFNLLKHNVELFVSRIHNEKLKSVFLNCFFNTLDTTVEFWKDGTTYVLTGDIDAMWLRDSSAQVMQYLEFADGDEAVQSLIKGLILRQLAYIKTDPYANSFSKREKGNFEDDECEKHPYVWERKFEIDSLCYPLWLAYKYVQKTGDTSVFNDEFSAVLDVILGVFTVEQRHAEKSGYYHYRPSDPPSFSVPMRGRGGEVKPCGLIWSGYRPSDDACKYGYLIPSNMFVVSVLKLYLSKDNGFSVPNKSQRAIMEKLVREVGDAIEKYGKVKLQNGKEIYAYETDALGNYNLMDDANVPSLLSIPYIGYKCGDDGRNCGTGCACAADKVECTAYKCGSFVQNGECAADKDAGGTQSLDGNVYVNTRAFILSRDNPYYYVGKSISGVGSPHTPAEYVWPISLMMQGLTSDNPDEINSLVDMLLDNDAGTGLMHESVNMDNPNLYTRSWFAWANSLFSLFVLKKADSIKYIS